MSSKDERKALIREVTDDLLKSKFTSEVGQKARVFRQDINNEHMTELREVVSEVGRNLEEIGAVPRGMQYVGSLSIHVFKSEILKTAAFATVSNTEGMPFDLADAALRELTGSTLVSYGKGRKKLRSGF